MTGGNWRVTGERAVTGAAGFNPSWQRHRAAYELCSPFLPDGRILDLGCGTGHSRSALAPRESVGMDRDLGALRDQDRLTVAGDLRSLPFRTGSFDGLISSHAIEHVPDAYRVVAEAARVLRPDGLAVFVTPNRLTFGKPDEVIDPYHFVEYDPREFRHLFTPSFGSVTLWGVHGSVRYESIVTAERARMNKILAVDFFRLRRAIPRRVRQRAYDAALSLTRRNATPEQAAITVDDFTLSSDGLDAAADLIAVCDQPR